MENKKDRYVLLNGQKITVSRKVYLAYYRPVWRESKRRAVRAERECSLETLESYGGGITDTAADVSDLVADRLQKDNLYAVLADFTDAERDLLIALYFQGKSEREYAAETGIPQKTISNRKKRLLERLRRKLKNL